MSKPETTICGIVMPISKSDDDHPAAHWDKVKDILSEAIEKAGCKPQPVWEGGAHDIIQAKILQNIYENTVVVCDLSTRNPNVMLEIGMRLTTKKPTLLIAEEGTPLPFDTGIIQTEFYDPRLEYRTTQAFINKLSVQISEKLKAFRADEYHPYLEAFEFETVEPSRVTVSSEERLTELIAQMDAIVSKAMSLAKLPNENATLPNPFATSRVDDEILDALIGANRRRASSDSEKDYGLLSKYKNHGFSVGDAIFHDKFGMGIVTEVVGNKLDVDFKLVGTKRVLSDFVRMV